ncbi:ATP-binding protein [Streptomyces celluloflavus]|uniref:ATP-binding protein n=1 Tax=Streptomyces celluloflavus TaxID=58344 RepID=A0ABW7R9S0_9ACTN|nr:ATP-binding protein [Streptomyces celluloflavus]
MSVQARHVATRLTPVQPLAVVYRMPSGAQSVGWARKELCRHLESWRLGDELARDAELLLSEVVTNAVQAQGSAPAEVGVRFALLAGRLWLEVRDASDGEPVMNEAEEDEECGRGLLLVDALASGWGVVRDSTGKTVWVELTLPDVPEPPRIPSAVRRRP